jgi:hypothetical protein
LGVKLHFEKNNFCTLISFLFCPGFAQSNSPLHIVQADTVKGVSDIRSSTLIFIDSIYDLPIQKIPAQQFVELDSFHIKKSLPVKFFGKNFYTRFSINNSSHPQEIFLLPGKLYRHLQLFMIDEKGAPLAIETKNLAGIIPIEVTSRQDNYFLLQSVFFKTYLNSLQSIIVTPDQLEDFRNDMYGAFDNKKIIGILLSGMLLMMILATLLNYVVSSKIEFLYNSIYSLCMFLLIFFTTYLTGYPGWFRGFF